MQVHQQVIAAIDIRKGAREQTQVQERKNRVNSSSRVVVEKAEEGG